MGLLSLWLLLLYHRFLNLQLHISNIMPPKLRSGPQWPASKVSDYATPLMIYSVPSQAPTSNPRVALPIGPWGLRTGKEKTIVVGCEWYFKPDGAAEVKKKFLQQLEKKGLGEVSAYFCYSKCHTVTQISLRWCICCCRVFLSRPPLFLGGAKRLYCVLIIQFLGCQYPLG